MNYYNGTQYVSLYPYTTKEQSMGYNLGEIYGPIQITLPSANWNASKTQTVNVSGIEETSQVFCVKILNTSNSIDIQKQENEAYNQLVSVQSISNGLIFTCNNVPQVDINLQIFWKK